MLMKYAIVVCCALLIAEGVFIATSRTEVVSSRASSYEKIGVTQAPATSTVLKEQKPQATLLFGGDVMLARGIGQVMRTHNDYQFPFRTISDIITSADFAIVNLESPISTRGKKVGSIYSFRAEPQAIDGLVFAGVDGVTLANNHAGDYGPEALAETFEILMRAGISVTGAGRTMAQARTPLLARVNGLTIAFFGTTQLAPAWLSRDDAEPAVAYLDIAKIKEDIATAKERGADMVVILPHWGSEYETKHNAAQKTIAHELIDAGAAMVIGHHPHVVQEVEWYKGGLIAYSLGNFIFDQNFSSDTHQGLLLKVLIDKDSVLNVEEIPIYFGKEYQPSIIPSPYGR